MKLIRIITIFIQKKVLKIPYEDIIKPGDIFYIDKDTYWICTSNNKDSDLIFGRTSAHDPEKTLLKNIGYKSKDCYFVISKDIIIDIDCIYNYYKSKEKRPKWKGELPSNYITSISKRKLKELLKFEEEYDAHNTDFEVDE